MGGCTSFGQASYNLLAESEAALPRLRRFLTSGTKVTQSKVRARYPLSTISAKKRKKMEQEAYVF